MSDKEVKCPICNKNEEEKVVIKPCPFCPTENITVAKVNGTKKVWCLTCGIMMDIDKWNTRFNKGDK